MRHLGNLDKEEAAHFEWLSAPSLFGLWLFVDSAPGFPWWVGVLLYPFVLLAYGGLYLIFFPTKQGKNTIRGWAIAAGLVVFQLAYWAVMFLMANHLYRGGSD